MNIIECNNITQIYAKSCIYENLSFNVKQGKVTGLLGKNGVGKSTIINIIMGFLKPSSGECKIYGKNINELSLEEKSSIALLLENHISYDFLSISQVERLYAAHYKNRWQKDRYYELVSKLGVKFDQKLSTLSCGQRSQVVLGLIFAQDPDLLILDDYAIGLDAGYRSLFVEYLKDFISNTQKSVLMTTHIMSGLENLIDDIVILQNNKKAYQSSMSEFLLNLKGIECDLGFDEIFLNGEITSITKLKNKKQIYGFFDIPNGVKELNLSFEDAFLGFVGRY